MRLTHREREIVLGATRKHFGAKASVWLFGSRVDDAARGGDIDLLVRIPGALESPLRATLAMEADIQSALDDPKVDILVTSESEPLLPIERLALETGVRL